MNSNTNALADLILKHLQGTLTEEENRSLERWKEADPENIALFISLTEGAALENGLRAMQEAREARKRVEEGIWRGIGERAKEAAPGAIIRPFRRWWAAAAILLVLATGSYFLFTRTQNDPQPTIARTTQSSPADLKPGGNKATLKLADGSTIILDEAGNGSLAMQGNTKIIKLDSGQLAYEAGSQPGAVSYNTLSTPRGGQFRIALSDGTKVWLNAASSLTYPTAFTGTERKVSITGEAYFEVTENRRMPFRVSLSNETEIEVLGTHFNVMAYANETVLETTLLKGSVQFRKGDKRVLLKPGQQSQLINGTQLKLVDDVNIDQVVAWKNGMQSFSNADIRTIMRKVERWYDVDVAYKGNITDRKFGGEIPREANLSELLHLFEVNKIHFKLDAENKKLTVMP